MYSKIAIKNIKKSFKDYAIYFLTLTFAVCIFYCFNSIDSQMAMTEMSAVQVSYVEVMQTLISVVSVFVSFILSGLIIYATNFLIRRRKKEFGIYMMLGMGKGKISLILFIETLIVGCISLIAGLILGIILSQGLSILTVKLFLVELSKFRFVFSKAAVIKSISYFNLIYFVVILFNIFVISKYKLIDLINSSRKSEKIRVRNGIVSAIILLLSMIILCVAYYFAVITNLNFFDKRFMAAIILGILGTLGFFYGLSSVILVILRKNESTYYKSLNTFTIRQITSKFTTNFISMTVICLMLFVTIGILTSGFSIKSSFETSIKKYTTFDLSFSLDKDNEASNIPIEEALKTTGIVLDDSTNYITMNSYIIDFSVKNMMGKYTDSASELINFNPAFEKSQVISVSDLNKNRELLGEEPLDLKEDEIYISSNYDNLIPTIERFFEENNQVEINGKTYKIKEKKVIEDSLATSPASNNLFSLIMPDEFCEALVPQDETINIIYVGENKEQKIAEVNKLLDKYVTMGTPSFESEIKLSGMTKEIAYDASTGMSTIILFIAIYIGIVFLLSSAAVLALQQLSQCNDSLDRYEALKKIGASQSLINKSILIEVLTFFLLPLSLAIVHSIVGINVVEEYLKTFGNYDILFSALITALIFIVVYGGYFYATYLGYKSAIE
ncbi:FtsX-like permease family protein [Clostridium culturomicium]|uniref:FtsX-like permease family protein n=1 Tax=Clostridium culturomicium TaxID=1499683 RepID=UPI000590AEB3|nr:ABC transporter permease [Clostridium culturomicium]